MIKLSSHLLLLICLIFTVSCKNDEPENTAFIGNAEIIENGATLSPGDKVHLKGSGFFETDNIILNFFWKTGSDVIPEGYIKGYHAKVVNKSSDGITIQMPYRKPASRVEICVMRGSNLQNIGSVNITDGLTPKELRLCGVYNASKILTSDERQISQWIEGNDNPGYMTSWALDSHPDFHSAVGASRAYGICGLSEENGKTYPYFLDFCTQEWLRLNDVNTIALFSNGSAIGAIQNLDGLYGAKDISQSLERSEDYLISRSESPTMRFPLPDGLEAGHFGEYPGAWNGKGVLLSANKGNGKWIPVFFNPASGFSISDEIEAKRLIPFAIHPVFGKDNIEKSRWTSGYIVVKDKSENGVSSLLYTIDEDKRSLSEEPVASFPNKALSASANHERPGTLTIHFEGSRNGNITFEYSFEKQEWTPFLDFGIAFDEIVWIN